MTPEVTVESVCLNLWADPSFPARFGRRVRAAGGSYSEARGSETSRFVTLPGSAGGLIDDVVRAYPKGGKTAMVVKRMTSPAMSERRLDLAFGRAQNTVVYWRGDDLDGAPSAHLARTMARRAAAHDWKPHLDRFAAEDAREAARAAAASLADETRAALEAIGREALRILDGANDIDDLKELAARYRFLRREAGVEDEPPEASGPRF